MPILDITDPKTTNFLLENYEKESYLRMKWVNRHKEQIQKAATFTGEAKNYTPEDVSKYLMIAGMPTLTRDHAEAARYRYIKPANDYLHASVSPAKSFEPPMKPVPINDKHLLRESKEDYLKARIKKAPEEKYNFVECNSWKYGWKLGESELKMRGPAHGVVCHMMHTLKSRVGPTPDPEHYGSPDGPRIFCESNV